MRRRSSANARKADQARRVYVLTADPATIPDSDLSAVIFQAQSMLNTRDARLYGCVDETTQTRVRELLAEQRRRRQTEKER